MPWLAFVVGINFFGIGAAFHTSLHNWAGGAICGVALASLIGLPSANPSPADQVNSCDLVVGIGCAMVLWAFTLLRFLHAEKKGNSVAVRAAAQARQYNEDAQPVADRRLP